MKKITKIEARELLKKTLDNNECGRIYINGLTIYYNDYKLGNIDDEDFFYFIL